MMAIMDSLGQFSGSLLLVGAGNMGSAMLDGWLGLGLSPERVTVLEPHPGPTVAALAGRGMRLNPETAHEPATVAVLAVKPQNAAEVLPMLRSMVGAQTLVVSIMAGKTIKFLEDGLAPGAPIVRSMPNTPAAIGRGITVATPNARVTDAQRAIAHALLAAIGSVEWVDDESLLDGVTAVSGSGPAYVFLLAESLARAGVAAGLPAALAARLARETVAGAGELLQRSRLDPSTLRQNVTSPGGTTAAALAVLMGEGGLDRLMEQAVAAAADRSRELRADPLPPDGHKPAYNLRSGSSGG